MLEFSADQLAQLQQLEHDGFVVRVRDELLRQTPALGADPAFGARLRDAHRQALAWGLHDAQARIQFLHQEAYAPAFHAAPAVRAWLLRPGATIEQRWRDLLALASARMAERDRPEEPWPRS